MYESFDEILLYFNLFLWNDRRPENATRALVAADFFDANANLKEGKRELFERLCQDYVSYVKGDSPFTFPFRLPPPPSSTPELEKTWTGERYTRGLQVLSLVESEATGLQAAVLQKEKGQDDDEKRRLLMMPTVAVLPDNVDFATAFTLRGTQFAYTGEPFLGPDTLAQHSAKFARVIKSIETGEGIVFVYSNYVKMGAELFAMALEEHGYGPVSGPALLANPAYKGPSKGSYALLTSTRTEKSIAKLVSQARSEGNRDGAKIRVIISSPLVAEGVDFRCVRQAHILDPWWNMSRIEQVIGRSLRTCSHTLLTQEKQNCTVYLHVVRTPNRTECYDEYTYRTKVEVKAEKIARVRSVLERAAMDCPLRVVLPPDWLDEEFKIKQTQSEGRVPVEYSLNQMLPPSFIRDAPSECVPSRSTPDKTHVRPLSAILDVRDEVLDQLERLLRDKPIWDKEALLAALGRYERSVRLYTIQQAIDTGRRFTDSFDRQSILESKGDLYTLTPILDADGKTHLTIDGTVRSRTMPRVRPGTAQLPESTKAPVPVVEVAPDLLTTKREGLMLPGDASTRFSPQILDAYIIDHLLGDAERRAYYRANPTDRIQVPGTDILVLGYGQYDPDELPIGDDKTKVDAWTDALALKFSEIIATNTIFASLNPEGKLTISKLRKTSDDKVVRSYDPASKTFLPTTCGTGAHPRDVMLAFAKVADARGVGIPSNVTKVPDICTYAELLAREETNCVWLTPQELSVLYGDPALRKRFTAEFKKTNPL
jgi:hypothetical protein